MAADLIDLLVFFFFKQKTAYEFLSGLVGSEMCIRYGFKFNIMFAAWPTGEVSPGPRPAVRTLHNLPLIHI